MPISTESDVERRRVERAICPTVVALGVLGFATAVVTIGLAALALGRESRRTPTRAAAVGPARGVVERPGDGGARADAPRDREWCGPRASARRSPSTSGRWGPYERSTRLEGGRCPASPSARPAGLAVVISVTAAALAARSSQSASQADTAVWGRRVPVSFGPPSVADGMRAATGQRAAVTVVASGAIVGAALAAALVFAASVTAGPINTPRSVRLAGTSPPSLGAGTAISTSSEPAALRTTTRLSPGGRRSAS